MPTLPEAEPPVSPGPAIRLPAGAFSLPQADGVALRLTVRNHPGVLSHVSGLFARRAFNLDGVVCLPLGDGTRSAVLLWVRADDRLEQLVRQLEKLEDVLEIRIDPTGAGAFAAVAAQLG